MTNQPLNPYRNYDAESQPRILGSRKEAGSLEVSQTFDLLLPTILGTMEDLVPGSEVHVLLERDLEAAQIAVNDPASDYGTWVYYPRRKHLVRFAPEFWHRLVLLMRNSTLLRDPEMKLSWLEIREKLARAVVGVTGCSVGNSATIAAMMDLRPNEIKIADFKNYSLTNANRVRISYEDLGRHKAVVTAEQISEIDPFAKISVYKDGVDEANVNDFMAGNPAIGEPKLSVLIEESDDPDMKIFIREKARKERIPVVMVTDMGSAVQLDIRRFDLDPTLPIVGCGVSDEELKRTRDNWRADMADRSKFYDFFFAMVGRNHELLPEFKRIVLKEDPPVFGGVPQLGSTAMAAGGIVGEAVARIMLGFTMPERMFINKYTGQAIVIGGAK